MFIKCKIRKNSKFIKYFTKIKMTILIEPPGLLVGLSRGFGRIANFAGFAPLQMQIAEVQIRVLIHVRLHFVLFVLSLQKVVINEQCDDGVDEKQLNGIECKDKTQKSPK